MKLQRFILIHLVSPFTSHHEAEIELEELKSLVETYGGATVVRVIQRKMKPDSGMYIGTGKAEEVATFVKEDRIDAVVINDIVKPTQLFNLTKLFWKSNPNIQVWDRVDLILNIFDKNARSAEAKLQIELARMRHMGPRMYGLGGTVLSRQGGGIGTRGLGETNVELMKRHWRDQIKVVEGKLDKLSRDREQKLTRRRELGFKTVSIVGYTNAGKSTLFNKIAKKKVLAKDELFATLDSTVGKLYLPNIKQEVLITDTIGFIQNLPPSLVTAFKSTLMESVNADLLLHVIDASDVLMHEKINVVESVLYDLGIQEKQKIYVFNKLDLAKIFKEEDLQDVYREHSPQFVSAKTGEGVDVLLHCIQNYFDKK